MKSKGAFAQVGLKQAVASKERSASRNELKSQVSTKGRVEMAEVVHVIPQEEAPQQEQLKILKESKGEDLEAQLFDDDGESKSKGLFKNLFQNPLETLIDSSSQSKAQSTATAEKSMSTFSRKKDKPSKNNLELGQGFGAVEVVGRESELSLEMSQMAFPTSKHQPSSDKRILPQMPKLKSKLKSKFSLPQTLNFNIFSESSASIEGGNARLDPSKASTRQLEKQILDEMTPTYGYWTLDDQMAAREEAKKKAKQLKETISLEATGKGSDRSKQSAPATESAPKLSYYERKKMAMQKKVAKYIEEREKELKDKYASAVSSCKTTFKKITNQHQAVSLNPSDMGISLRSEAVENKEKIVQDLLVAQKEADEDIAKIKNKRTRSSFLSTSKIQVYSANDVRLARKTERIVKAAISEAETNKMAKRVRLDSEEETKEDPTAEDHIYNQTIQEEEKSDGYSDEEEEAIGFEAFKKESLKADANQKISASKVIDENSFADEANQTTSQLKMKVEQERAQFKKLKDLEVPDLVLDPPHLKKKASMVEDEDSLLQVDFDEILGSRVKPAKSSKAKRARLSNL